MLLSGPMVAPAILPPAAFSNASIRPYLARISFLFCSSVSLFKTSVRKKQASPPFALISATIFSPASTARSRITTLAPSSARWPAIPLPRIPAPPVIMTTLSLIQNKLAILYMIFIVIFSFYCQYVCEHTSNANVWYLFVKQKKYRRKIINLCL